MFEVYRDPEGVMLKENPEIEPYFNDIDPEVAARAFYGTSHSPKVRGSRLRSDYALTLISDYQDVENSIKAAINTGATVDDSWIEAMSHWFNSYRKSLTSKYLSYCQAHASCLSSMIAGPANFPVSRAQNANNRVDRLWDEINDFRTKSKKGFLKSILPYGNGHAIKSNDPDAVEKLRMKIANLESSRDAMKAANKIIRSVFKKDLPEEEQVKMAITLLKDGPLNKSSETDILKIVVEDCFGGRGFASYTLTNTGAEIRRLKSRIEELQDAESYDVDEEFENGISVSLSDDNKIVIDFGFKPDEAIRSMLKRNAFKWSRQRVAWVRMMTSNAYFSYSRSVRPEIMNIEV